MRVISIALRCEGGGEKRPPLRSAQKWCQIIYLGYMSMPLKFFVMILIFGAPGLKMHDLLCILYTFSKYSFSTVAASFLRFCQNKKKLSPNLQNFGQLLFLPFFDLMTFFTW